MYVLLAFFMTTTGAVSSTVAEFNTVESCEAAKAAVFQSIPAPNKTMVCVAK